MGTCFSDIKGGKQAVGGKSNEATGTGATTNNNGGQNDAVDFFYKTQGFQQLFTQVELGDILD
ncbi:Protein BONZAI 3 [Glycine soja]|nr:Protein BONZAI 3 [Glycine soja]